LAVREEHLAALREELVGREVEDLGLMVIVREMVARAVVDVVGCLLLLKLLVLGLLFSS
jgi:hypothetical protein